MNNATTTITTTTTTIINIMSPSLLIYARVEALIHVDIGNIEGLPSLSNVPGNALANWESEE